VAGGLHHGHVQFVAAAVDLGEADGGALVHGMQLGALWAGAVFKVPQKVLIWGILIKVPLIHT
jgi:hypothetical protein